ncbi:MAG: PVC-type heme-binding CxxCH protein [Limisphaerales bacterium]
MSTKPVPSIRALFALLTACCSFAIQSVAKQPNIVFILTDNQGAWQLGCYGNPDFKTPHIDRMAREGVRFTHAYANNAVCSPTRATYLTGLTPSQHGVHRYLSAGRLQIGPQAKYTLEEFTTLPEVLHSKGYVCGLSGKWHLGDNHNPPDGFSFWVTKKHGHSKGFLNQPVIEGGKTNIIAKHQTEYWTDRGIEFIEANKKKPFFLYLAYNGPYTLSGAMREKVPSPWSDPYVDNPLPSFPRPKKIHPWQRNQHDLIGDIEAGRNLAGQVTAVDAGVGRILDTLKRLKIDDNTLVIYAADQGAVAGHAGFWGMGDHTRPLHGRDGTTHIPMIFRWPGKIPANHTEDKIVTNYDFMPSVLSLLGYEMPTKPLKSPGRDFSPTLTGKPLKQWQDELFYEFENVRSIRTRDWKYVERLGENPPIELYDLRKDPDELINLAAASKHTALRAGLKRRLHAWFFRYTDPKWDLWRGGKSKTRIGTAAAFQKVLGATAGQSTPSAPLRKPAPKPRTTGKIITPEKDHSLYLFPAQASLYGSSVKINPRVNAIAYWKTTKDRAMWQLRSVKPGKYTVVLDWAAPDSCAGQPFTIHNQAMTAVLKSKVKPSGGWGNFKTQAIGEITLPGSSINLSLVPDQNVSAEDLLDLRRIILLPEGNSKIREYRLPQLKTSLAPRTTLPGNKPKAIKPGADESIDLRPATASIHGEPMTLHATQSSLGGWKQNNHVAVWDVKGIRGGTYDIHGEWAMPDVSRSGMQSARITLDGKQLRVAPIRTTGGADRYASYIIGTVKLPDGDHQIGIGPNGNVSKTWLRLRSLRFVPANRGEFVMPQMKVPEGFEIVPAAIPPLVKHPMLACLDDRGRMFISESAGINAKAPELLEKRPHQILMLTDTDNDGVYDESSVFAEDLVLPNGAQWHDGALYVCSPPYVWKFEDTDDDGKADKQTPINGKFGFNGMSSAFHGPVLGPDGRMYWCGGQHGWTLGDTSDGFDLKGPFTSRAPGVFSSWPDGTETEDRAHGGMANPVEVTFTPEGEVLGTVAVYDNVNGRHDALLHWLWGARYNLSSSRAGNTYLPQTSYPLLPPVSRRGWVAPPGLTRYRSGAFGDQFRDNIFLCEFNTHRVYRLNLERNGAGFTSRDEIFLESTNPNTHFTDVFEDSNGSLLVVDTGGWFLYGCPTSSIEKPEIRGAIYRIRRKGMDVLADHRGTRLDWSNPATVASRLGDQRFTVRDRAIVELAKLGNRALKSLTEKLHTKDVRTRRNAVWALTRIRTPEARKAVHFALNDEDFSVRLTATRSIATHRDSSANWWLKKHVIEDEPAIRRECATALGRIGDRSAVRTLLKALETVGVDRFLFHAITYALIEIGDEEQTRRGLASSHPTVQRGAMIALDQARERTLKADDIKPLLASPNAELRKLAIDTATRHKWIGPIRAFLQESLNVADIPDSLLDTFLAFNTDQQLRQRITSKLDSPGTPGGVRTFLLKLFARIERKRLPDEWKRAAVASLQGNDSAVISAAIAAIRKHDLREGDQQLMGLSGDHGLPAAVRLAAAGTVAVHQRELDELLFFQLRQHQIEAKTVAERYELAKIFERSRLTPRQQQFLIPELAKAGPLELEALSGAFLPGNETKLGKPLFAAIEKSPGLASLSTERVAKLKVRYPNAKAANRILEARAKAKTEQTKRLNNLELTTRNGKADRGAKMFELAACNICHKVNGKGGIVGPELTNIGGIRTRRDLLEAIAFPNATFAREYEPYRITLKNGDELNGRILEEASDHVRFIDATNNPQTIQRRGIDSIKPSSVSLMPAGLDQALSREQLGDLIAYLRSLQ